MHWLLTLGMTLIASGLTAVDLTEIAPDLRLAIPPTWTLESAADRVTRVWRSPDLDISVAVLIQSTNDARDARAHLDEALGLLGRLATDFTPLIANEAITTYGGSWQHARYRFRTGAHHWDQDVVLARMDRRIVVITCSAPQAKFATALADFDAIRSPLGRKASRVGP